MGNVEKAAKLLAPGLSRLLPRSMPRLLGLYCDILQGRGAGTGWDLRGEVAACAGVLRSHHQQVVVDAGANYGAWSLALDRQLRSRNMVGRYYLLEPQSVCQEALQLLHIPKTVVRTAVAETEGYLTIHGSHPGFGAASMFERRDTYFDNMSSHTETVPVTTLDILSGDLSIGHIDLLKLDVEGAELLALRGARRLLKENRISAIMFEFGSANIASRTFFRDFWDLLIPHHYSLMRIAPGGRVQAIADYSEELEYFRGVSNYIAVRAEL